MCNLKVPKTTLFNNKIEKQVPNKIPKPTNKKIKTLLFIIPIKSNNSPIKLEVPGKLKFAILKKKKKRKRKALFELNPQNNK